MTKTARRHRRKAQRRFIRGAVLGTLGFCTAHAVDSHGLNPEWLQITKLPLPVRNLPNALTGLKIAHISDLHLSTTVSQEYIKRCVTRINSLEPDLVVMTGDYITYDARGRFREKIAKLIERLRAPLGVFACMGNHDYGVLHNSQAPRMQQLTDFTDRLQDHGIHVLRNDAAPIQRRRDRLWLVGLGDLWSGDLDPITAFADTKPNEPRIALSHNPDSIDSLRPYKPDVILAGHTHGRQIRRPFTASPFAPTKNHQYHAGMFVVGDTRLYVNRGLGRLGRPRLNCPPEITLFTLRSSA